MLGECSANSLTVSPMVRIENYPHHFEGNLISTKPMDERGIDSSLTLVYSDHQKF